MIVEFLNWWVGQLATLIPGRIGARRQGADALILELPGDWNQDAAPLGTELLLIRRHKGQDVLFGRSFIDGERMQRLTGSRRRDPPGEIRLRVPARLLLECEVVLPLAAERELDNVLRYEMDRLTPFKANQLIWAVTAAHRDPARGKLKLRLSMLPQAAVAAMLTALREAGFGVAALEVPAPEAGGGRRLIGLSDRGNGIGRRSAVPSVLAGACAVLALVAVGLPFVLQGRRAAMLNHEKALLAPQAAQAEALRRRLAAAARTENVITAAAEEVGNPLAVLAAVTQALPDTSYLSQLSLNHRQLNIAGQSASAAALLAALSAYPLLTDVAFTAPVTHDTAAQKDLFSIQSDVAPQ